MADTNTKGVFTLGDVRSRQAANAWPVVGVSTEASVTQSANTVDIGDTINFYTNSNGRLIPGQILYWAINSNTNAITSADFVDNSINGTISANTNGEVILSKTINNIIRVGDVIFNIKLLAGSLNGTVIATTSNVQINKTPPTAPGAPTIGTAYANGSTGANVTYTAPANSGRSTILSYTATANIGGISATVYQSGSGLISLTGLTAGTSYSFTVTATNAAGTSAASAASNGVTPVAPPGSQAFTTAGTYSFIPTTPSVSVVAVGGGAGGGGYSNNKGGGGGGLGYKNNYPVTPGTPYTVVVGSGGPANNNPGVDSYFSSPTIVKGGGANACSGAGGTYTGDGGGNGGSGNGVTPAGGVTGAGAGGYSGTGGPSVNNGSSNRAGNSGTGGAGGSGGYNYGCGFGGGGGGGVDIFGQGSNGAGAGVPGSLGGGGGSGGGGGGQGGSSQPLVTVPGNYGGYGATVAFGRPASQAGLNGGGAGGTGYYGGGGGGGAYGGGGGGAYNYPSGAGGGGASGAVRIIWGPGRVFPTTCVASP